MRKTTGILVIVAGTLILLAGILFIVRPILQTVFGSTVEPIRSDYAITTSEPMLVPVPATGILTRPNVDIWDWETERFNCVIIDMDSVRSDIQCYPKGE